MAILPCPETDLLDARLAMGRFRDKPVAVAALYLFLRSKWAKLIITFHEFGSGGRTAGLGYNPATGLAHHLQVS